MIDFNKKNIDIKTLGERLQSIREKSGIAIEEMSKVTKINKNYLRYIESDEYDKLPSNVYVKGFLRSYSNFLGIDSEDVLKIYKKERGIQSNLKKSRIKEYPQKKQFKIPMVILPLKTIAIMFIGVFFVGVAWYFYIEAGKFSATPRLLLFTPVSNSIVEGDVTEISGTTDVGNKITINGQIIFVDESGGFKEKISLKKGINNLKIKAVNKFNKEVLREINLSAQYEDNIITNSDKVEVEKRNENAEDEEIVVNKNKIILYVKVVDGPVWLSVLVDDVNVYKGTMLADTEQAFEAEREINITSGMASRTLVKNKKDDEYRQLADVSGVIRNVIFKNEKEAVSDEGLN